MMSQRRLIRKAIRDLLKDRTDAGPQVFTNRSIPTGIEDLPVILIYTKNESSARFEEAPKRYERVLTVEIEAVSKGRDDGELEDNLDTLAKQIEDLMEIDETLGKDCNGKVVADQLDLVGTEFNVENDGQSPVGVAILNYNVTYYDEIVPSCFSDFVQANVDYQVGHHDESSDETIDAQDEVQLPQS